MENEINAFATSCYRVMLNIKRIDHVLNTTVYSISNTVPLIHLVRHRQLKFLGHILRMSKEEPAWKYALYIPCIGKRRPGRPRTSYLTYVQRFLDDNEGVMQEQQIAALADDLCAWRNLAVACSTADGWWWHYGLWKKQNQNPKQNKTKQNKNKQPVVMPRKYVRKLENTKPLPSSVMNKLAVLLKNSEGNVLVTGHCHGC